MFYLLTYLFIFFADSEMFMKTINEFLFTKSEISEHSTQFCF